MAERSCASTASVSIAPSRSTSSTWRSLDASGAVYFRRINDVYVDGTSARVVVCDAPVLSACRHQELQIPLAWTDTEIDFAVSRGSFAPGELVYLHVVDPAGTAHFIGPVTIDG